MTTARWYGLEPWWQVWVEAGARREHGATLRLELRPETVKYHICLDVPARWQPVLVEVRFHRAPAYPCYGLRPEEYPQVFAAPGDLSPHRMPNDALCLYYPLSPETERWRPANGLLALLDMTRNHLVFEHHWRSTGGRAGGEWLGPEQPHGLHPDQSEWKMSA